MRTLPLTIMLIGTLTACAFAEEPAKPQAAPPEPPVPIYKVTGEVKIDGILDDPCWKNAVPVLVQWDYGKKGVKQDHPSGIMKFAWDDYYLYIGYETFDKNLIAVEKDPQRDPDQGPPGNRRHGAEIWSSDPKVLVDVVEFFVSFNDPHFFWEIHQNALNDFNDVWCVVPDPTWQFYKSSLTPFHIYFGNDEYIHDQGEHTLAKAVHLKPRADGKPSTVNDSSDTDTGYTAELRLPWAGLGAPQAAGPGPWKMAGEMLRVLSVVQDGDLPQKYHHSSAIRAPGGFFHTSYDSWPVYKCVADTGPAEDVQK